MPEKENYGVTPTGFVTKRFDVILDELHNDLSDKWGVNTRHNPKSFLNVHLTSLSDKLAELWEIAEQTYYSMYPFSAEDISLDNAIQFGGISREEAKPTIYPIHCECVDGTLLPKGTQIKTSTNPAVSFTALADSLVTRSSFNRASIRIAAQNNALYTIALNGTLYSYASAFADSETDILTGLASAISDPTFTAKVSGGGVFLLVSAVSLQSLNTMALSGNLTTRSITGIVNFASESNSEIVLPDNTINQIVTAVPGLISVVNLTPYIAGRLRQRDVELRQSYADKIFIRSNRMLESIRSAILNNVQSVTSVACYQNDSNTVDVDGRWPHCVEIVADGGNDYEIALQIWDKKADGIQTFGNTEIIVPGDEGEPITIRFNRPEYLYVWYSVTIIMNRTETLPPNYVEAIQAIIVEAQDTAEPGKSIIPQRLFDSKIYGTVPGIAYIDTKIFYSKDPNQSPSQYENGLVQVTPRQRAVTEKSRIEVRLGG